MKILIWIVCFLCLAVIQVILKDLGIILGGILAALLFAATWFLAQKLCKAWDKHRHGKKKIKKEKNVTVNKGKKKSKIFSFLFSNRKIITILMIVGFVLSITCLIGYNICQDNMRDALYHYDIAFERQHTIGCGEWSCEYCEGKEITPVGSYRNYSPYVFGYYQEVSDTRANFELVGVLSFIFAVILLIVFFINMVFARKRAKTTGIDRGLPRDDLDKKLEEFKSKLRKELVEEMEKNKKGKRG